MRNCALFCLLLLFTSLFVQAQSKEEKLKIKFGKITAADFTLPDSPMFKNADAAFQHSGIRSLEFT